jgi:hypothetical protein
VQIQILKFDIWVALLVPPLLKDSRHDFHADGQDGYGDDGDIERYKVKFRVAGVVRLVEGVGLRLGSGFWSHAC